MYRTSRIQWTNAHFCVIFSITFHPLFSSKNTKLNVLSVSLTKTLPSFLSLFSQQEQFVFEVQDAMYLDSFTNSHPIHVPVEDPTQIKRNIRQNLVCQGEYLRLEVGNGKEMFYLTTHSTHFIYGYMASGSKFGNHWLKMKPKMMISKFRGPW